MLNFCLADLSVDKSSAIMLKLRMRSSDILLNKALKNCESKLHSTKALKARYLSGKSECLFGEYSCMCGCETNPQ